MRIPRIYTSQTINEHSKFALEQGPSHHLIKVLRMGSGRELILFDGGGFEYPATIVKVDKKVATVTTTAACQRNTESPLKTTLAIGISRGDRMEWVIQKATELGASEIVPLLMERSEVKLTPERQEKKHASWKQVVISACEQCQRNRLPTLQAPTHLSDFLQRAPATRNFVLHHRSDNPLENHTQLTRPESVCIVVGPEGGISDDELKQCKSNGFETLCLGPRVMRTETAPLSALSVLQHLWGDL